MITVYIAGLIYHYGCTTDTKRALVPDGTAFYQQHYASLFVEPYRVESSDWWDGQKIDRPEAKVVEFRIPNRSEITFPDDANDRVDCTNLDQGLTKIIAKKRFQIDLTHPETIAEVPIRSGTLKAFAFTPASEGKEVAIVKWTIQNDSRLVTISASSLRENTKTLILKNPNSNPGLEIVFSNTADLIHKNDCSQRDPSKPSHFMLFDKLNKNRPDVLTPDHSKLHLDDLEFNHPYLKYLQERGRLGDPECVPTCC